jgi:hypothetical protein
VNSGWLHVGADHALEGENSMWVEKVFGIFYLYFEARLAYSSDFQRAGIPKVIT